jgi:DNA-binding NtrC family response regulator
VVNWALVAVASPFVLMGGVTTALAFQKEPRQKSASSKESEQVEPTALSDSEMNRAIVRAWTEHPDPSFQSVADALGMPKSTLYGKVRQLERQGVNVRGNNHR